MLLTFIDIRKSHKTILKKKKLGFKPHVIPGGGADAVARIMQRYKERAKREGVRP